MDEGAGEVCGGVASWVDVGLQDDVSIGGTQLPEVLWVGSPHHIIGALRVADVTEGVVGGSAPRENVGLASRVDAPTLRWGRIGTSVEGWGTVVELVVLVDPVFKLFHGAKIDAVVGPIDGGRVVGEGALRNGTDVERVARIPQSPSVICGVPGGVVVDRDDGEIEIVGAASEGEKETHLGVAADVGSTAHGSCISFGILAGLVVGKTCLDDVTGEQFVGVDGAIAADVDMANRGLGHYDGKVVTTGSVHPLGRNAGARFVVVHEDETGARIGFGQDVHAGRGR